MGYFSNGTEHDMYEAEFCNHCVNNNEKTGCPIMTLHWLWNYDAVGEKADQTKKTALEMFIPCGEDETFNGQCKMFVRIEEVK